MAAPKTPSRLGPGGRKLWRDINAAHPDLDAVQLVQLEEACRAKDRVDKLDELLCGNHDTWMKLVPDPNSIEGNIYELRITQALDKANATANLMKQLLAAMRLPDSEGKRPQRRSARGAQKPSVPGGAESAAAKAASRWGA